MSHARGQEHYRYRYGGLYFDGRRWRVHCRNGSSITWARVLMWNELGRPLAKREHVHHGNRDRTDDRVENLSVLDIRDHGREHAAEIAANVRACWDYDWSRFVPACRECLGIDRPHFAKGYCQRCYSRNYMRARRAKEAVAA